MCAYPIDDYGLPTNASRPENAELRVLKLFSYFVVKNVVHILFYQLEHSIPVSHISLKFQKNLSNLESEKGELYKKFIEKYHEGEFEKLVSVLVSEWATGGDLLDYIRKGWREMTLRQWKIIFFQILYTFGYYPQTLSDIQT